MENNKKRIIQIGAILIVIILIAFLLLIFKDKIFETSSTITPPDNTQGTNNGNSSNGNDEVAEKQPTYSIFPRPPYLNASDILSYNTNIGGSKTDIAKKMFLLNDLYIVGETNSNDYDFKGEGKRLFLAKVNTMGTLLETHTFLSDTNISFVDAFSFNAGTLNKIVCLANKDSGLSLVSLDLKDYSERVYSLDNYFGVKLFIKNDCIIVVAEFKNSNQINNAEVLTFDFDLKLLKRYTLTSGNNLKVKDIFVYADNLLILTDVNSPNENYFMLNKLTINSTNITFNSSKSYKTDKNTSSIKLVPNKNMGFGILFLENSPSSLLKLNILDRDLNLSTTFTHSLTGVSGGDVFVNTTFDNSLNALVVSGFYVIAYKNNLSSTDYVCTHGDLQHEDINALKDIGEINDFISTKEKNIFLSTYTSTTLTTQIKLTAINKMHSSLSSDTFGGSQSDTSVKMLKSENESIYILANSYSKNYDIANNFGECDVWLTNYLKK